MKTEQQWDDMLMNAMYDDYNPYQLETSDWQAYHSLFTLLSKLVGKGFPL